MSRHSMGRSISSSLPLVSHCVTSLSSLSPQYRCDELRVRIHENHLSYLNRDETPAKLEMRTKIECLIAEYLFLVPHSHKFSYIEVANCLNRSIIENSEFSAYKAASAFEALEKYATNLITHPWRREYHSICPYSGFYRHVVQKMLIGAEQILYLMGFVNNGSKCIYQLNELPIDADKVSRVSLECLVAFVECQIMIQIRESLKSKGHFNCSWREIHAIRVEYVCGQADAIKLICEKRRTAKLIDYENTNAYNTPKRLISSVNGDSPLLRNGFSLIDDHLSPQKHYVQSLDDEERTESFDLLNYPIVGPHSFPLTPPCQYCLPHSNSLPACPQPPVTHMSSRYNHFPTSVAVSANSKSQTVNKAIQAELTSVSNGTENCLNKTNLNSNVCNKKTVSDGVAPNSNSQTRRDSLQSSLEKTNKRGSYYDNLDSNAASDNPTDLKQNSIVDKKQLEKKSPPQERNKLNLSLEKRKSLEKKKSLDGNSISRIVNSIKSTSVGKSNVNNNSVNSNNTASIVVENKSLPSLATVTCNAASISPNASPNTGKMTKTDETQSDAKPVSVIVKEMQIEKWSCTSCTYLNVNARDVCEMCHRSRKSGHEAMPLVSGGRECSRCTLVNDKEEKFCRACDTSLADSPTYI